MRTITKTTKTTKRVLVSILSAALMMSTLMGCGGKDDSKTDSNKDKGATSAENDSDKDNGDSDSETIGVNDKNAISNPRLEVDGSATWDKIQFGSYKQTVEFGEAEPIKWRILSIDEDNNALLLADMGLDCKPYNEERAYDMTWETCTLRKWLNEDFYKEAFTEEEQGEIKEETVYNSENPDYGTDGGSDTADKIFLLSIWDAGSVANGFDLAFGTSSATRECQVTDYARINGAKRGNSPENKGKGYWWLRSSGFQSDYAACIDREGCGDKSGNDVSDEGIAIRPALKINLSSSLVTDAGEVASDGTVTYAGDGYNNPNVTDDKTVWDCVYFGRYKQNISEIKNEPIEWRVLSVDGDEALLLADKELDCKRYNEERDDVTWETCSLRTWLNEDFYNEAFNEEEQSAIKEVTIKNDDNPKEGTEGGNDTTDKVYLLSIQEVGNNSYGFEDDTKSISDTRECKYTDYAMINGVELNGISSNYINSHWLLRTPGKSDERVSYVDYDGNIDSEGDYVNDYYYAVRPAIRIDLNSTKWETAGTVSTSDSNDEAN